MPTLEITDEHAERIDTLREEIESAHAGPYARVKTSDVISYLLDLAETVEDPDRTGEITSTEQSTRTSFPRKELRHQLEQRNRQHSDPEEAEELDLYTIAERYDITGRSEMAKAELIDAIVDRLEELYHNPLALVELPFPGAESTTANATEKQSAEPSSEPAKTSSATASDTESTASGEDDEQLNAMLSLLDTHEEKWREASGDARYEVTLPDGSTEQARTKDDVRALLFKHY